MVTWIPPLSRPQAWRAGNRSVSRQARAVRQQVLSGDAQHRVGLAGRDRKRGLMDHGAAGSAGNIDGGKKFRSDSQMTCDHAARHAPLIDAYRRREQAIDVGKPEPGIFERGHGGVRLQLQRGAVRNAADPGFADAGDGDGQQIRTHIILSRPETFLCASLIRSEKGSSE